MKRVFILTGLFTLLLGLVANLPAPLLQSWIASDTDDVIFYRVSGTVVSGKAAAAAFGTLRLHDPKWQINPWSIFRFRLSHDIAARSDTGPISLTLERGMLGGLYVKDVQGSLPVAELIKSARLPAPPMLGAVQFDVSEVSIGSGTLESITGDIALRGLSWALTRPALLLGNYKAVLTTDDEGIRAEVSDNKAALLVNGSLQLAEDGAYAVDLRLRPAEGADQGIANLLRPLGAPEAGGWNRIKQNGNLAPAAS